MKTKRYFVSYCYSRGMDNGFGSTTVEVHDEKFDNGEISKLIAKNNRYKNVVILFFKELKRYEK